MKRMIWTLLLIVVLVGGGFATFRDPGRIHMYAVDGSVLAETELEGWCSGSIFWSSRQRGDDKRAAQCRKDQSETMDTTVAHNIVQLAFCKGIQSEGFQGNIIVGCVDFLQNQRLWPTMDGKLTATWSDSYPYPLDQFGTTEGEETEDRQHERSPFER